MANELTLKWGTLKSWEFDSEKAQKLLEEYNSIGQCVSAAMQYDTPRQKEIICELIDICDGETIYLHWDGKDVSKEEAKNMSWNMEKKKQNPNPVQHL